MLTAKPAMTGGEDGWAEAEEKAMAAVEVAIIFEYLTGVIQASTCQCHQMDRSEESMGQPP